MYLTRTNHSGRYVGGTYPTVRIDTPCPLDRVNYCGFKMNVITKTCRLNKKSHSFRIYLGDEQYCEDFYKDGCIDIKQELCPGKLQVSVKLLFCGNVVDEDSVCVIVYNPNQVPAAVPCAQPKEEEGPCHPLENSESCDSDEEEGPCHPLKDSDSCDSDEEEGPCHPLENSESCDSDEEEGPCHPLKDSDSCDSDEEEGPCHPLEEKEDCKEVSVPVCKPKVLLFRGPEGPQGTPGPCGPRGENGDGGLIKKISGSACLSSDVRTYIVCESKPCDEEILLTLPTVHTVSQCYDDTYNGQVVTVHNDSGQQILVQAPVGYCLRGVGGFFLLGLNQSATFHNLKQTWYIVSK